MFAIRGGECTMHRDPGRSFLPRPLFSFSCRMRFFFSSFLFFILAFIPFVSLLRLLLAAISPWRSSSTQRRFKGEVEDARKDRNLLSCPPYSTPLQHSAGTDRTLTSPSPSTSSFLLFRYMLPLPPSFLCSVED